MNILEMDYRGLRKVISGGQCGADRGGLEGAAKEGVNTGGWAPKGWRTAEGPQRVLEEIGLKEHSSEDYAPRTKLNVKESDGTLIIASNLDSAGSRLTIQTCKRFAKPYFVVAANLDQYPYNPIDAVVEWVLENNIEVLNVAGNRDYSDGAKPRKHHDAAKQVVQGLISQLRTLGKLNGTYA